MRLSLSPEPEEWEQGRYRFRDDDSDVDDSTDEEFVMISHNDFEYSDSDEHYDDDDDDEDEDYPHPVGFPAPAHSSWGRTRFCLDPTLTPDSIDEQWKSYGIFSDGDSRVHHPYVQSYPPLSSYIDPRTASTSSLLRYDGQSQRKAMLQEQNDKEMDQITRLLKAASLVDTTKLLSGPSPSSRTNQDLPLAVLADTANQIRQQMQIEQKQMEREHMEAAKALKMLLEKNQRQADKLLEEEKRREEEDAERRRGEQEAEEEMIRQQKAKDEAEQAELETKQEMQHKQKLEREKETADADAKETAKTEYITKAKKLVLQLKQLRESIEPFEQSKAVSKRRLNMKKVVRGKVNTLSENAEKIKSVAADVGQAITAARAEDEDLKKQQQAGNSQITPEMTRGKRYLFDLLASSIMVRVQAEGFNGLRGDGFPIANMLAIVSLDNKELVPIMAAHIYTVCPTAIPKLPNPSAEYSEEALMKSLGMSKGKDGEYETFSRFLLRTEAIISLVADIMASNPPNHQLLGGHKGAVDWLTRFLALIPAPPQKPLPLLAAPVLNAFLVGAGHMLANKHPEEFKVHLNSIEKDVLDRVDEGPIGEPSAIRLRRTMRDGFEGFKNNLPSKALPELYHGADESSGLHVEGSTPRSTSSDPFGSNGANSSASNQFSSMPNPFGGSGGGAGGSSFGSTPAPFGSKPRQAGNDANQTSNPFGAPPGGVGTPFGENQTAQNGWGGGSQGGNASNLSFGMTSSSGTGNMAGSFNNNSGGLQSPSPFGAAVPHLQSPFGAPAPTPTPFGQAPSPSPLGAPPQKPFAPGSSSNPFGSGSITVAGSSPFGGGPQHVQNSPFGGNSQQIQNSPFDGGSQQVQSSPFGGGSQLVQNSPFGSGSQQVQNSPFGGGSQQVQNSPFGGASQQIQNSPFGGGSGQFRSSPFGGGTNQQSTPFGGGRSSKGNTKPPCKFYAQGKCKYGNNCRFSHS